MAARGSKYDSTVLFRCSVKSQGIFNLDLKYIYYIKNNLL